MTEFLAGLDRERIVRWTAIYLVIYVVVNLCAGLAFGIIGGLSAATGALTAASVGGVSSDASAASSSLIGIGGLAVIMGLLYLISVPICGVAAFGLFRRKAWARNAAVVALGYTTLISLVGLTQSFSNIIWVAISLFGVYLFWSDAGIKQVLSQ
ncbi:MAG TPA: hypothetical protein VHD90_10425 [Phototrophicaceae bacterium]|nr:hypothetical protein [Phototrophicaceae bacterium]